MFEVYVNVDTNDADYVSVINDATQEDIDRLLPIAAAIKAKGPRHNWENDSSAERVHAKLYSDVLSQDDVVWFREFFCPFMEHGFHTIKDIDYYVKPEKTSLL